MAALDIGTFTGKPFAPLPEAYAQLSRMLVPRFNGKLPQTFRLDVPITDNDLSRWRTTLDGNGTDAAAGDVVESQLLPDVTPLGDGDQVCVSKMCVIAPFQPASVAGKLNAKQLAHRAKWLVYRQKIPLYQHRNELLASIRDCRLVTVVGAARSGKSTQLPQLLAETELFRKRRIFVVTATAAAAVILAQRLREEKGETEASIAHCTPTSYRCTEATQIVVCPYDVFFRVILADVRLVNVGCVVFDDLHVHRDIYVDLSLNAVRDLLATPNANKDLRVVLNCRDDQTEATLLQYFQAAQQQQGQSAIAVGRQILSAADATQAALPVTLYLDDCIQWLEKVKQTAKPFLIRDPNDIADLANHVQVLAQVMASEDADLSKNEGRGFAAFWLPLVESLLRAYDEADRSASDDGVQSVTAPVVVVFPNIACCRTALSSMTKTFAESTFRFFMLGGDAAADAVASQVTAICQFTSPAVRMVILTTAADVVSTGCMPLQSIGCLIDLCREDRKQYDVQFECDRVFSESSSRAALRSLRSMLVVPSGAHAPVAMHLITRQALHSNRTKQVSPHPATMLTAQQLADTVAFALRRSGSVGLSTSLAPRFSKWLSLRCWDLPASLRGEMCMKLAQHGEAMLLHLGHCDSSYRITPLGAATLLQALPSQVARLLLHSALFSEVVLGALVASLWLVGDIFDLWSNEAAVASAEARSFFHMGVSSSDFAVALNAYLMWRRTASQAPEEESELLETARLSLKVMLQVQRVHTELVSQLHKLRLTAMAPTPDDIDAVLVKQQESATALSPTLNLCISSSLHPNVAYHLPSPANNGAIVVGVPRLVDSHGPSLLPATVVPCVSSLATPDSYGPLVALQRVVHPTSSHIELGSAGRSSVHGLVMFCGQGSRQALSKATRSRGWNAPLTNVWRQTAAAAHLPPPPQLQPRSIPVVKYNPVDSDLVQLDLDGAVQVVTSLHCSQLLSHMRDIAKKRLAAMCASPQLHHHDAAHNDLRDATEWFVNRCASKADFLRDRRRSASQDDAAQVVGSLVPYYAYAFNYERPALVHVVAPAATAHAVADAGSADSAVLHATSMSFSGVVPPDQAKQTLIRQTAQVIAKNPNRNSEVAMLQQSGDMFAFLDPDHPHHEYYLYILKQEAPHMDWLGDDLMELEKWLQELEDTVSSEVAAASYEQQQHATYTNGHHVGESIFDGAAAGNYEEVSEEQYHAELQREQDRQDEERRRLEEEAKQREAANPKPFVPVVPKPGSATQFVSPDASAQGIGSGVIGGGSGSLLQTLMAMRSNAGGAPSEPPAGTAAADGLSGPAAASAALVFGNAPGVPALATNFLAPAQPAFSAQELLAIIGGGAPPGAPPAYQPPPPKPHPLTIPPPPLPSEALSCRHPSVIVSPLPSRPGINLPLSLAKALGETLDLKVGPTFIVGDVARIDVPSSSVELRAIALKFFYCLGEKLTITKNDRIIDNPERGPRKLGRSLGAFVEANQRGGRGRGGGYAGRGGGQQHRDEHEAPPQPVTTFVAPVVASRYIQPPASILAAAPQPTDADDEAQPAASQQHGSATTTMTAGAFTDSDEE